MDKKKLLKELKKEKEYWERLYNSSMEDFYRTHTHGPELCIFNGNVDRLDKKIKKLEKELEEKKQNEKQKEN